MTKTQVALLKTLQRKMDPLHPDFRGSDRVKEALLSDALRLYHKSWVLPLIDALVDNAEGRRTARSIEFLIDS